MYTPAKPKQQILMVEDNALIAEFTEAHLRNAGFDTVLAETGEEALELLERIRPALIVLDVVLGDGIDGYEVCRRVRQRATDREAAIANVPVIMLTARAEEADRIDGFNAGVDDYLMKPFNPEELIARIRAVLRRTAGTSAFILEVGGLQIDPLRRQARANGATLDLTPKEFELLHLLASNPGQVFPRATLLEQIWGYSADNTRTVDVHIQRLREKLATQARYADAIATEWGVGYRMVV